MAPSVPEVRQERPSDDWPSGRSVGRGYWTVAADPSGFTAKTEAGWFDTWFVS